MGPISITGSADSNSHIEKIPLTEGTNVRDVPTRDNRLKMKSETISISNTIYLSRLHVMSAMII